MINELIVTPQLWANIDNIEETQDFLRMVISEYVTSHVCAFQNGRIDGKLAILHLEKILEQAILNKNPDFDHRIKVNIDWDVGPFGFVAAVYLGIADFDMPKFGSAALPIPIYYQ
jgi:hypothetical protein